MPQRDPTNPFAPTEQFEDARAYANIGYDGDSARIRTIAHAILRASYPHMDGEKFAATWKISTDEWRWQFLPHARTVAEALDRRLMLTDAGRAALQEQDDG